MNYLTSYRIRFRDIAIAIIAFAFCLGLILSTRAQIDKPRADQKETKITQTTASQMSSESGVDKESIRQFKVNISEEALVDLRWRREYQFASPAHNACGAPTTPDGRRTSINVEILGGSLMVGSRIQQI